MPRDPIFDVYDEVNGHGPARPDDATSATRRLHIINPIDLADLPIPDREWIVEDWLPVGTVTALYGDGGVGKTLLAQQLMASTAMGCHWCGWPVMQCRSLGLFCEDDEAELHRRQAKINAAVGCSFTDLHGMRWISGVGQDNSLVRFDAAGKMHVTEIYADISAAALDLDARLIVLDTAADLFPGNENDRHQVRQFINQLTRLAIQIHGAVLLNAHPSRSGLNSGNLDGGSTAWSNTVRSRWSLARPDGEEGDSDPDARILVRRKANYARTGEEMPLKWWNGCLVPPGVAERASEPVQRPPAESVFLDLLAKHERQGQWVSHSKNAQNFAPKVFSGRSDRHGYNAKALETAMVRLFETKAIEVIEYDRFGHRRITRAAVGGAL